MVREDLVARETFVLLAVDVRARCIERLLQRPNYNCMRRKESQHIKITLSYEYDSRCYYFLKRLHCEEAIYIYHERTPYPNQCFSSIPFAQLYS